ncbi:methyltransferase [Myxococcota bacterium]|nr:methyltransferase [Myxococcota bacterium]
MSGVRRARRSEALVLDPEVLRPGPVCEFQSSLAVEENGGVAIQPWRDAWLADQKAGRTVHADARELASGSFEQAVVHLQKSRAATFDDLAEAWRILAPAGELLFSGPNTLGIVSAVKRLAEQLGQPGVVVANRARARVVRFFKQGDGGPEREATDPIQVEVEGVALPPFELETLPGVFSARRLDPGSELLLEHLARLVREKAPKRVVDLGCGTGVLGLVAARLLPEAEILLVDADARAVECARRNAARLGVEGRCRVLWWDAHEKPPETGFELALVNPPFHHRGPEVDLAPALALFESLAGWLKRHGRALLVANRTLPYEAALARQGEVAQIADARGYKLLSLNRSARSSGARGRKAPGARSGGSSRSPIRSR